MDSAACLAGILGQPIEVATIILIGKEAGLAVVAALDEMDRNIWQGDAGAARHKEPRRIGSWSSLAGIQKTVVCPLLFQSNGAQLSGTTGATPSPKDAGGT